MSVSPVEKIFTFLNETASVIQDARGVTYLEALAETGESWFLNEASDSLEPLVQKRLDKQYHEHPLENFKRDDLRKGFQLAVLKGMKEHIQPNHQMTPDSIAMVIGYLLDKFTGNQKQMTILDPALGTGNLVLSIMNQLDGKVAESHGVEIDEVLIRLSYAGANLTQQPLHLYTQDSLEPLFIDPADAVVSDLPVGYYPNDLRAADYELQAPEGHSYAHHLFIEQSIQHVKNGGYLFFLVPNGIFESPLSSQLHDYLKKVVHIQGLIKLPSSLFKNEQSAKSILILQKQGEEIKPPKQVLLAEMPKLSNGVAVQNMMGKIQQWMIENK
ncbi:class I SAM-dependent methyltransferase [Jeotgalibacillus sp. R-1-5s-1]|uniref:class I SAM-dependent methyltransferase n=1 Tax=Jeotgalibacillus sp. R-1-5s-1 TaxID=2555897 RepID=UPI00106ADF43|nr:class I SAM-dependent methyltransferase [Jeotgalibacillus sp. R-1-5s-1]TFD98223.1 class I SAM-dependent methyltransferase [Jeotgalibacillus sp. R-1-5s-1]